MYAVIVSGGKQYRVKEGDTLKLETLPQEIGASVDFDQVLMVGEGDSIKVGRPFLDVEGGKVKVSAKVVSHGRHAKIRIIKFNRRKHHMKSQGHRQNYTEVQITKIAG
jgi:large subunit ribosomal protein L21